MKAPLDMVERDQVLALLDMAATCASAAEQWPSWTGDQRRRCVREIADVVYHLDETVTPYLEVVADDDEVLR